MIVGVVVREFNSGKMVKSINDVDGFDWKEIICIVAFTHKIKLHNRGKFSLALHSIKIESSHNFLTLQSHRWIDGWNNECMKKYSHDVKFRVYFFRFK